MISQDALSLKKGLLYAMIPLFSFLTIISIAQQPYIPKISDPLVEPWRWKQIPEMRGKGVRCISPTPDGSVWFGVDNGLYCYNGTSWTFYNKKNSAIDSTVNFLQSSPNGQLFAGTHNHLFIYNKSSFTTLFAGNQSFNFDLTCLKVLADGTIVAGINQGILVYTQNEKVFLSTKRYTEPFRRLNPDYKTIDLPEAFQFGTQFPRIDDLFEFTPTEFWILNSQTPNGTIFSFDLNKAIRHGQVDYKIISEVSGQKLGSRQQIIRAKNKKIWIISGHYSSGVFSFDGKKWEFIKLSRLFGGDELHTSLIEANDGSVWVGGLGKLFVLKNNIWNSYEAPQLPIPYSRIIFQQGRNNKIWIAGIQNEVYSLDYSLSKWITYHDLNYECESPGGKKWFLSVDNQVVYNVNNQWFSYSSRDGLMDNPVSILCTKSGVVWAAGSNKGIAATAFFDGSAWIMQTHPQLSWGIDYRAVFEDNAGNLWFGGSVDADRLKGQQSGILKLTSGHGNALIWTHYSSAEGISQSNAYGIGQSVEGAVWLGGTQLLRFDGKRWSTDKEPVQLHSFVNCMHNSNSGKLWVGSRFYGIYSFDGKAWMHYNVENGLSSNSIISIFAVNDSTVWVSTDNGICRFDGQTWVNNIFFPSLTMTREGGSIVVDSRGSVWINKSMREWKRRAFTFNTTPRTAYENFYTVRYKSDTLSPNTQVDDYPAKVDHFGNSLINWEGNDQWEDTPSEKLEYSFRLNDGPWSKFSATKYHTFTNLPAGHHTFEVRSRDLDFNIDRTPARIEFEVLPPVWKQAWFIFLVLGLLTVIAIAISQIFRRNNDLSKLNLSLSSLNHELVRQKEEILAKNLEITEHQNQIIEHQNQLEYSNTLLEKQNEEIRTKSEKLEVMVKTVEELSQARVSFFTNVSHEFRTPLTLILGPLEKLMAGYSKSEKERNLIYTLMHRNAQRLLRLINQLLEFRKIEFGTIELSLKPGDIVQYVKEATNLFMNQANQRKVTLKFISTEKSILTAFDYDKIEKIIFNLLSNAFKFTPEKGTITVEVARIRFNESQYEATLPSMGHFVSISVQDTGIGIATEHIEHVFEKFYQVTDATRTSAGSGLGLSYIKELVEIHGGKIIMNSIPGKGTTFQIYIPIINIEQQTGTERQVAEYFEDKYMLKQAVLSHKEIIDFELPNNKPGKVPVQGKDQKLMETILIVEDDSDLMDYLTSLLSEYNVYQASDGAEGYEKAKDIQPDIIISDIMMPVMNGLDLCRKVKTDLITSHIPVILLTARALVEHKIEGLEFGADDYIEKPFNEMLLSTRVKNLIDSRKKLREHFLKDFLIEPTQTTFLSADEKLIKNVIEHIEKNIGEPAFNIVELSKQFYLSRSHFTRKIKQLTGISPSELLTTFRLKKSAQLILHKKFSVSEISYMVGFEHPNSLSRAFKKEFGMSPTEYAENRSQGI